MIGPEDDGAQDDGAQHVLAGHLQLAEACADAALRSETRPQNHPNITLVACGSGTAALLPEPATDAIRQADHLLYEAAIPPDFLNIARREVALTPVADGLQVDHQRTALPAKLIRRLRQQIDYLRRCGSTHAAIKPADHKHWQQAHQAIRHHFQHMPDSPRSRRE